LENNEMALLYYRQRFTLTGMKSNHMFLFIKIDY